MEAIMRRQFFFYIYSLLALPIILSSFQMGRSPFWQQRIGDAAWAGTNTLKVRDVYAMPGQQIIINVDVKNDDVFHSFQLDLDLPTCLTVLTATIDLTDRKNDQTLNYNLISGNKYRFIGVSSTKSPFRGNSGSILRMTCSVSGVAGTYNMVPSVITLLNASWQNILTSSVNGVLVVFSQPAKVRIKTWLEGWYTTGQMRVDLRTAGNLPWTSPYPQAIRTATNLPADIAEWILLELRKTSAGDAVWQQSYLLKSNGLLCEMDGTTVDLILNVPAGSYYLVLRHRNHAAVMSAAAQSLSASSVLYFDFSLGAFQYFGLGGKALSGGGYGIPCGDMNNDKIISTQDYVLWYHKMVSSPSAGYHLHDLNGDRYVNDSDFTLWQTNARNGLRSTVP